MSEREIVARGVARMGSIGCTHVTYGRDGRKTVSNFVDVAVRRHMRTQTAQAAGRMTMDVLASYGHDLVVTDAHWGARPEHAEWQGKPCCLRGRKKVDGAEYPDIRDLTGYGTVTGLHGANCTHSINPYYPGVTPLPDRDFEAFERHYGMTSDEYYEATQKQRAWERRIRQTKREVAALEQADFGLESPTYVQKRLVLGCQQASLAKLCREKNLVRQYDRELAYGVKEQPRALRTEKPITIGRSVQGRGPAARRKQDQDLLGHADNRHRDHSREGNEPKDRRGRQAGGALRRRAGPLAEEARDRLRRRPRHEPPMRAALVRGGRRGPGCHEGQAVLLLAHGRTLRRTEQPSGAP